MNDMYAMLALMQYENSNVDSTNQSNAFDSATLNKNELDVHGCSHEEVAHEIENLLIMQYNYTNIFILMKKYLREIKLKNLYIFIVYFCSNIVF